MIKKHSTQLWLWPPRSRTATAIAIAIFTATMRNRHLLPAAAAVLWAAAVVSGQCSSSSSPSSSIPECAQSCISNAVASSTTCQPADYACQCADATQETILRTAENCFVASCGEAMTFRSSLNPPNKGAPPPLNRPDNPPFFIYFPLFPKLIIYAHENDI